MAETPPIAVRNGPLDGRSAAHGTVTIRPAAPAARLVLRAPPASRQALSSALGFELPERPKASAGTGGRTALWLGPDEWLVIDEAGGDPIGDCAGARVLHSAVDVSHRNTAVIVSGTGAAAIVNAGCPQDLSLTAFPVGACSRTILGKAEIVILRTAEDEFRVECWRSFSDFVFALLVQAARDEAA